MKTTCQAGIRDLPWCTVITLSGDLDGGAADVLTAACEAVAAGASPAAMVLDLTRVGYINSNGIALIVSEIFDITCLSDFIDVYPGLDRALSGLKEPGGKRTAHQRASRTTTGWMTSA